MTGTIQEVATQPRQNTHVFQVFFVALALSSIIALIAYPTLGGTKIVRHWVLTGQPIPRLGKILVIAVLENYLIRQALEDEMEERLAESGVEGVKSHMVLPPRNEMAEAELKEHIKDGGFDGVLLIRPINKRTETKEIVTGTPRYHSIPPTAYAQFWPYWHLASRQANTASYFKENTIVRAEFNLYSAKDEKLLWSGESDTVYSKDFKKLGRDYARAIVNQLQKDRVIGKR